MGRLHEIRLKSEAFVANMNIYVARSIELAEPGLIKENQKQMLKSKDSENRPLVHRRTGRPTVSPQYAQRTGKRTPNLHQGGNFQNDMFLTVNENALSYDIGSFDYKTPFLVSAYGGDIFGINDKAKARNLTGRTFKRMYKSLVLGR